MKSPNQLPIPSSRSPRHRPPPAKMLGVQTASRKANRVNRRAARRAHGADTDKLRAEAERWLAEFAGSLGAVFPDDEDEFSDEDDEWLEVTWAAGRRVRFAHPDAGYPGEAEEAMKALTPGEVYTIAWADIGQSRTDLNLARDRKSVGRFNSVFFEPADDEAASTAGEDR